jgi:hypothetical protein
MNDYQDFVISKIAPAHELSPRDFHVLHATLGLATEVLEYSLADSPENVEEELGDILFYMTFLGWAGQVEPPNQYACVTEYNLTQEVEILISLVKKWMIYQSDCYPIFQIQFWTAWESLLSEINRQGFTLEAIVQSNKDKLNKRYKSSFTAQESEERKDKQ